MDAVGETQRYQFGDFELDLGAHMLRLIGEPVRLERRPFELLVLLVTRHGMLVPRDDIIGRLWPGKVVIDFDTGLNTLVRKVRQALGDSPDNPVFIETVAGLGYRFIAPVTQPEVPVSAVPHPPAAASAEVERKRVRRRRGAAAIVALLVAVSAAFGIWHAANREPSRKSIAVLPFENLTRNDELNYLAAGLAEETSASLAQIDPKNVRLIGRVSAQAFATSNKPMSQIGRELGVDFVVASSLRAEQSKVRVTARLVRVADSEQVWAATFDREMTSVLGLQRELSSAIAEQIRLRLSPEVAAAMARRQTLNPEAYDLYLKGRYQWSLLTPASSRRALTFYEGAIARDPGYALAWAGIAQVLSTGPITGDADPAFGSARARDAVRRAVQFGAELTEVQYALGHFHFILDWDWPAAENALRKAVAIDPNNALAYLFLGHVRSQSGDQVEARTMVRRARELDPLFSHTFALSSQVAFQARDYPSAMEFARQAIAINPEAWVGYLQLGQTLSELGKYDDAIAAFENAARYSGGNSKAIAYRAYVLAKTGRKDEARAVIAALQAKARERYVSPYAVAIIYAGLSEREAALQWLERAYAVRDVHLVFLPVDPRWDALRDDPRFQSLLKRCRFCGKGGALVAGRCQAAEPVEAADERVSLILDHVDARLTVASANIDGIWTATASAIAGENAVSGLVIFTGPVGKTRQMGMCLVQRYASDANSVACDTVDECSSTPQVLPAGGSRYCVAPNNSGAKYCHYRPGEKAEYCVGSPTLDLAPTAADSYRIDIAAAPGTQWLSLACFNACAEIPPAISELATVR
jgi:TolB-like protein/DNA-binding winged helix-turn-helix (wHTH) protein/Flp pilus assembly protein TadD